MRLFFLLSAIAFTADAAYAQQVRVPVGGGVIVSRSREVVGNKDFHFIGDVEMELEDTKIFADDIWFYSEERRAVATGNVLYTQGNNRISADRAEMNTETRLGTFYHAWGLASVQPQRQQTPSAGFVAPQMTGQDTDVIFFGETIQKVGPKKYKITNGGFTTCVQPSPRWDFHADTVELDIGNYTLLRNVILNVKNVPLFYLPILYYPTKEEGRATGFLLPTYGSTNIRGQQLSNAFFWVINRSHDATIKHDWFSKGAQGWGGEYRYVTLSGDGTLESQLLNQRGNELGAFPSRSFNIRGAANQRLPGNFRARGRVDYFSSLVTNQTIHSNIGDSSQNRRTYGGNVTGSLASYSVNATFDRSEYFNNQSSSVLTGTAPRVSISRSDRPLSRNSAIYFSFGGEAVRFERQSREGEDITDTGLARFDFSPQIRYPFKRWQWFTVNSTVAWRNTFYTRSLAPDSEGGLRPVDDTLNRQYVTLMAQAVGPVFNRVFNTPDSGYAERFKHTVEPFLTVKRTSSIDNANRIIRTDGTDGVIGSTDYTYGLNNRVYARRRVGQASQAQEILNVELRQTYYSDEASQLNDLQYTTTYNSDARSHFSPISLAVRATPATNINSTFRAEIDSRYRRLRTTSLSASYNWTSRLQTTVGWNRRFLIEELSDFKNPTHYVSIDARAATINNRVGGNYSMNFDVLQSVLRQQRMTAFYNAQCCGIAFEYQTLNYGSSFILPSDHRFFMSFTLAGLGNFSPFSGALSTIPR